MQLVQNKDRYDLVSYKNDYGIPVIFSAYVEDGFSVGDKIEFVTEGNIIPRKEWEVVGEAFEFELKFTEEEAEKLSVSRYDYSFKQYRENQVLDTIMDGQIVIKRTVLWQD